MILACYNKENEIRMRSSSGGVYYAIAEKTINDGGIVYAAVYEGMRILHKPIREISELISSCGSKYAESEIGDTFRHIKKDLLSDKKVLFVGTPCQCSGLRNFLGDIHKDLLMTDFICHGIPSQKVLKKYIDDQRLLRPVTGINMRDKSSGWSEYRYSWKLENQEEKVIVPQSKVTFMEGFTKNYYLRPSCYECQFKGLERITDITLGDYWGVWNIQKSMDDDRGTSLVMLHSDKGKEIFNSVAEKFVYEEIKDLSGAIQNNPSILEAAQKTMKRKIFFDKMEEGERFDDIIAGLRESAGAVGKLKSILKKLL